MADNADRKLIIDEDWKAQVLREKEEASAAEAATPSPPAEPAAGNADYDQQLPPANFMTLMNMLGHQALMCLGQIPHPLTGKAEADLPQAKHLIDMFAMLEVKTKGNLTGEEAALLDDILHQLRMAYVHLNSATQGSR